MKDIRNIHKEAMLLSKVATLALSEGDEKRFLEVGRQAFLLEKEAGMELISDFESEPTRSVLLRSAATLAFNIGEYQEAEKLIYMALSGNVYFELKQELNQLLLRAQQAQNSTAGKVIGIQNAYMESLKEKAVYFKVEPKEYSKYSKAIVVDYIIDFLKNIQNCYVGYSEVNFKREFDNDDFRNYGKVLNLFKKESKTLCLDLKFASFGVSIAVDNSVMNFQDIATSDKFRNFKTGLFEDFKKEVVLADYNSADFQQTIQQKYNPEERTKIFSPIVESLKDKSSYRISIVDKDFDKVIKKCPTMSKKTESLLKVTSNVADESDDEVLLKRTFELTNSEGHKKEKLSTETLEYAEFSEMLTNINYGGKQAYFVNPYEVKIIFNHGILLIDDTYYKIYVEHKEAKELKKQYNREIIEKFDELLQREALNNEETILLDLMKSTIVKGW